MSTKSGNSPLRGNSNQRRKRAVGLAATGLLFLIAGIEIHLRRVQPPPPYTVAGTRSIRLKEHSPRQYARLPVPEELSPDRETVLLRTDKDGFIEPSAVHSDPDLTVVFLGGSTTECKFLPEEKRIPFLAGRLLEERLNLKINSYNAGVSGNHSLHSLNILINKILPLDPDIVILTHNQNDLVFLIYMGAYWADHPTRSLIVTPREQTGPRKIFSAAGKLGRSAAKWLIPGISGRLGRLRLQLAPPGQADEWAGFRERPEDFDLDSAAEEFGNNIQAFIDICRSRGIEPVLATQASRFKEAPDEDVRKALSPLEKAGISYSRFREAHRRFNRVVREAADRNSVILVDLEVEIPQEAEFLYDPVHFSGPGAEAAAALVAGIVGDMVGERAPAR